MEESKLTPETKAAIGALTQFEACRIWRFAPTGHPYIMHGEVGDYFDKKFKELGGFTPEISKALGWGNG